MAKVKKLSLTLDCPYTDDELADKRDLLADVILDISKVENNKAQAMKAYKEDLDGLYAESSKLAHQIKKRSEFRLVDCAVEMNAPNVGEKITVRLDTGEMLKTEMMTDEERQEEIDFGLAENREVEKLLRDAHSQPQPPKADETSAQ